MKKSKQPVLIIFSIKQVKEVQTTKSCRIDLLFHVNTCKYKKLNEKI